MPPPIPSTISAAMTPATWPSVPERKRIKIPNAVANRQHPTTMNPFSRRTRVTMRPSVTPAESANDSWSRLDRKLAGDDTSKGVEGSNAGRGPLGLIESDSQHREEVSTLHCER